METHRVGVDFEKPDETKRHQPLQGKQHREPPFNVEPCTQLLSLLVSGGALFALSWLIIDLRRLPSPAQQHPTIQPCPTSLGIREPVKTQPSRESGKQLIFDAPYLKSWAQEQPHKTADSSQNNGCRPAATASGQTWMT